MTTNTLQSIPQPPAMPVRRYRVRVEEIRPLYRDNKVVVQRVVRTWVSYEADAMTPWDALIGVGAQLSAEEAS